MDMGDQRKHGNSVGTVYVKVIVNVYEHANTAEPENEPSGCVRNANGVHVNVNVSCFGKETMESQGFERWGGQDLGRKGTYAYV